jgi:hypothetical protein
MKLSPDPLPIILCGGGSILIDINQRIDGVSRVRGFEPLRDITLLFLVRRLFDQNITLFVMRLALLCLRSVEQ